MRSRRRVDGVHRRAVAVASREPPAQAREETRLEGEESCEEEVARQEEVVSPQEEVTRVFTHVKLNHPVVMIFSCVGDGTPRCVKVQSAGQIRVKPFFGDTIKF